MRPLTFTCALALAMAVSGAALAQAQNPSSNANAPSGNQNRLLTIDKLKQDLQNAGFTDVKVVAEAFMVQAKTKDGSPVTIYLGPGEVTAVEAVKPSGPNTSAGSAAPPSNPAPGSTPGTQHK